MQIYLRYRKDLYARRQGGLKPGAYFIYGQVFFQPAIQNLGIADHTEWERAGLVHARLRVETLTVRQGKIGPTQGALQNFIDIQIAGVSHRAGLCVMNSDAYHKKNSFL